MPSVRTALQAGIPEFLPDLIALAGTLVLLLMLVALAGIAYKAMTGGIEWPEDKKQDDDAVHRGDSDDDWKYY